MSDKTPKDSFTTGLLMGAGAAMILTPVIKQLGLKQLEKIASEDGEHLPHEIVKHLPVFEHGEGGHGEKKPHDRTEHGHDDEYGKKKRGHKDIDYEKEWDEFQKFLEEKHGKDN